MKTRAALLGATIAVAGCALDPIGTGPTGEGGAAIGATGAGPASGATSTSAATSTGAGGSPAGPGSGGAPGQGGAGGTSGGSGGDDAGAGGSGASGGAGGEGGEGGEAGSGGAGGFCGDGTVDPGLGEECDEDDPLTCDATACTWLGACGAAQDAPGTPGGTTIPGDTAAAPSTTTFAAACGDPDGAPMHLYTYVTTAPTSFVEVVVFSDEGDSGLADPVLSLHAGCADETKLDCRFQNAVAACCADLDPAYGEALVTDAVPSGTVVTAAITGHQGDSGTYDVRFREIRYLLVERFEAGVGSFTTSDWTHVGPHVFCAYGGGCMVIPGTGDYPNEILASGPIDASAVGRAVLGWFHRVDNSLPNPDDEQIVQVSADGGATWTDVHRQEDTVDEFGVWKEIDVSAELAGASDARVRFVYADGGGGDNGWFVDEVYVIGW